MTIVRVCPMTDSECTRRCHMLCVKRLNEEDDYKGDIKVTRATKQDGTTEIVDAQSFYIKNPYHTEQQELYELQQKAQTAIAKFMTNTEDVGEIPLDTLVKYLQELPECIAFTQGIHVRKLIVLMLISNSLKYYIDRKQP